MPSPRASFWHSDQSLKSGEGSNKFVLCQVGYYLMTVDCAQNVALNCTALNSF